MFAICKEFKRAEVYDHEQSTVPYVTTVAETGTFPQFQAI
jgi:hypothetical protein